MKYLTWNCFKTNRPKIRTGCWYWLLVVVEISNHPHVPKIVARMDDGFGHVLERSRNSLMQKLPGAEEVDRRHLTLRLKDKKLSFSCKM